MYEKGFLSPWLGVQHKGWHSIEAGVTNNNGMNFEKYNEDITKKLFKKYFGENVPAEIKDKKLYTIKYLPTSNKHKGYVAIESPSVFPALQRALEIKQDEAEVAELEKYYSASLNIEDASDLPFSEDNIPFSDEDILNLENAQEGGFVPDGQQPDFDTIPGIAEPAGGLTNFGAFISYRKDLYNLTKNRYYDLKNKVDALESREGSENNVEIQKELKELRKDANILHNILFDGKESLQKQLEVLEEGGLNKEVMSKEVDLYAQKDFERVDALLAQNDPEHLDEIEAILSFWVSVNPNTNRKENPFFRPTEIKELDEDTSEGNIKDKLLDISNKANAYTAKLQERKEERLTDIVNSRNSVIKTFELTNGKKLTLDDILKGGEGLKDISLFDMYFMDMQHQVFSDNGILPQVMQDILNETMSKQKAEATVYQKTLQELMPEVEKAIEALGGEYVNTGLMKKKHLDYSKIFRAKDKDGFLLDDIVQKVTNEYQKNLKKHRDEMKAEVKKAKALGYSMPKEKQLQILKDLNNKNIKWFKENSPFLNINKLAMFNEAGVESTSEQEAYYQELITKYGSEKSLKKVLKKQSKLVEDYKAAYEVRTQNLLQKEEVTTVEELSEKGKKDLEQYDRTNNPAKVAEAIETGNQDSFITSFTTKENKEYDIIPDNFKFNVGLAENKYFNSQFDLIEGNEALYKFYDLLTEVVDKVHKSQPAEDRGDFGPFSLPAMYKSFSEALSNVDGTFLEKISEAFKLIREHMKRYFTQNIQNSFSHAKVDPATGQVRYKINSGYQTSNKMEIKKRVDMNQMLIEELLGKPGVKSFNLTQAPQGVIDIIAESLLVQPTLSAIQSKLSLTTSEMENFNSKEVLEKGITNQVVAESSVDLPSMMNMYATLAAEYTARQEVLPTLTLLKEQYQTIKDVATTSNGEAIKNAMLEGKTRTSGLRDSANKQMERQFTRTVLNDYESKHGFEDMPFKDLVVGKLGIEKIDEKLKGKKLSLKTLTRKDKAFDAKLQQMENIIKEKAALTEDPAERAKYAEALKTWGEDRRNLGRRFTFVSVMDGILNYVRLLGLGWNINGASTNLMQGEIANTLAATSGKYFSTESYYRASQIMAGSVIKNASFGKVAPESAVKARWFIDQAGAILDPTNELQKSAVKSRYEKGVSRLAPMELTKRVEYINQGKVYLSTLLDVEITGKNGEKSNVFDALDIKTQQLKPEFRTEENIFNWENITRKERDLMLSSNPSLTRDQYTSTVTKANESIVKIHGDYDDLRGNIISESLAGKAMLMFKRWLPNMIYDRIGKKQANLALGIKENRGRWASHTAVSGAAFGSMAGLLLLGPFGTLLGMPIGAAIGKIKGVESNLSVLSELALMGKNLAKTIIGLPTNIALGKEKIKINDTGDMILSSEGKVNPVDLQNYKSNVTEIAILATTTLMVLLVKGLTFDDDDEEDSARRYTHNWLMNKLNAIITESTQYLNAFEVGSNVMDMAVLRFFDDVTETTKLGFQALTGDTTYKSGKHAGTSKFTKQLFKNLPSFMKMDGSLGMEGSLTSQYKESFSDKWFWSEGHKYDDQYSRDLAKYKLAQTELGRNPKVASFATEFKALTALSEGTMTKGEYTQTQAKIKSTEVKKQWRTNYKARYPNKSNEEVIEAQGEVFRGKSKNETYKEYLADMQK